MAQPLLKWRCACFQALQITQFLQHAKDYVAARQQRLLGTMTVSCLGFSMQDDTDKRQLLRWWVHADFNKRPIAPHFAPRSNVTPTGGFIVPADEKIRLPFFPYSRRDREGLSPVSPVK